MLQKEIQKELTERIIPFWQGLKDIENGGFYGLLDFDLNLHKESEKGCILNSRILWFFANAYETLGDEALLEDAKHAYDYLVSYCIDEKNGGLYWSTNYDGSVLDSTKHTYNQAFGIYALSSYYKVTKNEEALQLAFELFELIETKCRDEFGYLEAFDLTFKPISNEKLSENGIVAEKTMNTLLHVFEAYTELYRVTKDKHVEQRLKWILDIFGEKVYNPAKRRQEVFFDKKMNSLIDLHSYGHDIETAWLIDLGCEVLDDSQYKAKMSVITDDLTEEVYRLAYEGNSLVNECEDGNVDTTRVWWVQAEAMVGFYNAYEKHSDKIHYKEAVINIWNYIKEHIIDKRPGSEWFWEVDKDGNPTNKRPIVEPWKCPYHSGRMCFEILRREARG